MFKFILLSTITKPINSSAFNHEPKEHKKSAELCLLFCTEASAIALLTIIKQQPALYNGIVLFSLTKKEEYAPERKHLLFIIPVSKNFADFQYKE